MKFRIIFLFIILSLFTKTNMQEPEFINMEEIMKKDMPTFICSSIPEEIQEDMNGKSMIQGAQIKSQDLSYLRVSYYGFDDKEHIGEIIVNKKLGEEVVEIFRELYENKYMIEKIERIDKYNADDVASMEANNTSAFCYRMIAGTNKLSNHAKGCAIDINPMQNPQIKNGIVYPSISQTYADRSKNEKGMIKKGDIVYNAFVKRGWKWGGEWKNPDYQHFEKSID